MKSFSFHSLTTLFLMIFVICGCSQESPDPTQMDNGETSTLSPTGKTFVYHCNEDSSVVVKIDGSDAWFILEDTTVHMPQVTSASGARFMAKDYLYWSKGDEAIIEIGNRSYGNCALDREEATWQDAKLRDVQFRATGFEPGWYMEIYADSIKYVLDYGERSFSSASPEPNVELDSGDISYTFNADTLDISIRITDEGCISPSGKQFPSTAYLTVDGDEYRGCGRALQ